MINFTYWTGVLLWSIAVYSAKRLALVVAVCAAAYLINWFIFKFLGLPS